MQHVSAHWNTVLTLQQSSQMGDGEDKADVQWPFSGCVGVVAEPSVPLLCAECSRRGEQVEKARVALHMAMEDMKDAKTEGESLR
jgi:hypothetical protein